LQEYQRIALPLRDGEVRGFAVAINKHNQAVGYASTETSSRAFVWDKGTAVDLGTLNGENLSPTDINDRGQVVGWSGASYPPGAAHAFFWDKGTMQDLGPVAVYSGPGPEVHQVRINNRGQVLGHRPGPFPSAAGEPFLWENGVTQTLPLRFAAAINDRGQVAGDVLHDGATFTRRAAVWEAGVVTELGTLGGNSSWASAISNTGWVVGGSETARETHAFRWRDGRMEDLGSSGVFSSGQPTGWEALFVNDRGQVVATARGEDQQLFWDQGSTQRLVCVCFYPMGMNRQGAVVGWHTWVWQDGVSQVLDGGIFATAINDRGAVTGSSRLEGGAVAPTIWLPVKNSEPLVQESVRRGGDSNPR
jgi:probable HAF family extracellular repeat protein